MTGERIWFDALAVILQADDRRFVEGAPEGEPAPVGLMDATMSRETWMELIYGRRAGLVTRLVDNAAHAMFEYSTTGYNIVRPKPYLNKKR